MDMEPAGTTSSTNESLITQGIAFLRSLRGQTGSNNRDVLSGSIEALEKSGFKPAEITEVLKRYREDSGMSGFSNGNEFVGNGNRQGWFLNSVLPAVLVLGAGAVALYLTGGEDEDSVTALKNESDLMTAVGDENMDARTGRQRSSRNRVSATEGQYNRSDEETYNDDRVLRESYDDYESGYDDLDRDHDAGLMGGERGQHRRKQAEPDWAKEVYNFLMLAFFTIHFCHPYVCHSICNVNFELTSSFVVMHVH